MSITAIVAVFNVEKYLSKCLDSIVNQTFKDLEIICVNDGSTDCSLNILEEFAKKDKRIIIVNQENAGLSAARNSGLKIANNECISFIDSDDWLNSEAYEKAYKFFSKDIDLVEFGVINHVESHQKELTIEEKKRFWDEENYFNLKIKGILKLDSDTLLKSTVTAWNKLYRKSIIDKYRIRFPEGLLFEDNSFHYKYCLHAEFGCYIGEKLYNRLVRQNSIMGEVFSKKSNKVVDRLTILNDLYFYFKKNNALYEYKDLFSGFLRICLYNDYVYCKNENKSEVLNFAHKISLNFDSSYFKKDDIEHLRKKCWNNLKWLPYIGQKKYFRKLFNLFR